LRFEAEQDGKFIGAGARSVAARRQLRQWAALSQEVARMEKWQSKSN
jgi:hypothetical protein